MPLITLEIPDDRYGEFLVVAGTWLAGDARPVPVPTGPPSQAPWTQDDGPLAEDVLSRMTPVARRLFGMLAAGGGDVDDRKWSAQALNAALGLSTPSMLAGVYGWPGKYFRKAGRDLPFHWESTEEERGAHYWMDAATGATFLEALAAVDPSLHREITGGDDA